MYTILNTMTRLHDYLQVKEQNLEQQLFLMELHEENAVVNAIDLDMRKHI